MQTQSTCIYSEAARGTGRAFTLVELLVVIGIIAVLIAVLMPAVLKARREADRAHCLSNMRNMQVAQWNYATDNKGYLIQAKMPHGGHVIEDDSLSWFHTLSKYYGSSLSPRCKADSSIHWEQPMPADAAAGRFRVCSYGINTFLDQELCAWGPDFDTAMPAGGWYTKINRIRRPAETIQFVEMAYAGENAATDHAHANEFALATTPLYPSPAIPNRMAAILQINAHGGKGWNARANYGFLDGHAESLTVREVYTSVYINRFDPASPQPRG